jgi:hypothetical protein
MVTLVESIEDRYGAEEREDGDSDDSGYVCFVSISSSPEVRQGLLPPVMTLIDYNIECLGAISSLKYRLNHISELDLSNNLISDWLEVASILASFKGLTFLNLANNLLSETLEVVEVLKEGHPNIKKVRTTF